MPAKLEGNLVDQGGKYAILISRWNDLITSRLLDGSVDTLRRHSVDIENNVTVVWAPGSYELPLLAQKLADSKKFDAIIALACVIRGGTPHFDYVAAEVSKGLANVGLNSDIPITFGVLTTNSIEQAVERAGTKMGNKGAEAALAAIEMVNLVNQIKSL
ncbi:MAG: 6,7-dimethyl-8-ribityllumazine synthase [Myxococcota bacterium]|nr:6,7-dimethyl-8-ribityllumazine synthase [Myxococcota bacterium]